MLDTHIAVRLFEGSTAGLSARTRRLLDSEVVAISPAVVLELELLHEIRRIMRGGAAIARYLREQLDISVAGEPFAALVDAALPLGFTRDPFDRLIVAHAALTRSPLVSADRLIAQHYAATID